MRASLTDTAILSAAAGDRASVEAVMRVLSEQVRAMVVVRLAIRPEHLDAVEDIAQQSALAFYEGLPRLENRTADGAKAFLSGIVNRKVADFLSDAARHRKHVGVHPVHHVGLGSTAVFSSLVAATGSTPSSHAGRAEQVDRMLAALGQLKDQHREVITLAFFDQLPTQRISDLLGISPRAASMLLLRAVRALGRALAQTSAVPPQP